MNPQYVMYENKDCPGIDIQASNKEFPVIETLLSIPFSLLHNLPRLAGMVQISAHQQQLITMGSEIIRLWWWDPPPNMIRCLEEIRIWNIATNQHDNT